MSGLTITPGVSNFAYVESGLATEVVADENVGGLDVGIGYNFEILYLVTEGVDELYTEDDLAIILE